MRVYLVIIVVAVRVMFIHKGVYSQARQAEVVIFDQSDLLDKEKF